MISRDGDIGLYGVTQSPKALDQSFPVTELFADAAEDRGSVIPPAAMGKTFSDPSEGTSFEFGSVP